MFRASKHRDKQSHCNEPKWAVKDSGAKVFCFLPSGVASAEVGGVKSPRVADAEVVRAGMLSLGPRKSVEKLLSGSENRVCADSEEAKKSRGDEVVS